MWCLVSHTSAGQTRTNASDQHMDGEDVSPRQVIRPWCRSDRVSYSLVFFLLQLIKAQFYLCTRNARINDNCRAQNAILALNDSVIFEFATDCLT